MTLLHRRGDLRETMSGYLIPELDRASVAIHDRSEIAELHGEDGKLVAVTLKSGEAAALLVPLPLPRHASLHRLARRRGQTRRRGFVLTRSGSTKRCAAAVGEGAMAVQFIHAHFAKRALAMSKE